MPHFVTKPLLAATAVAFALIGVQIILPARADNAAPAANAKPYTVQDGKVDKLTYRGYLYYGDACLRCHGPDGLGSSYAPSLVDSLKSMSKEKFEETVINGKQEVNTANDRVMPALGTNEDVVDNLENIYAYLKGRSDGAIGRGHPERIGED